MLSRYIRFGQNRTQNPQKTACSWWAAHRVSTELNQVTSLLPIISDLEKRYSWTQR